MLYSFRDADLRVTKTYKALNAAMCVLLKRRSFGKMTVNDLCAEALISRTTFYTHFPDKYDFLRYWLVANSEIIIAGIPGKSDADAVVSINQTVEQHKRIIKNLLDDANHAVLEILEEYLVFEVYKTYFERNDEAMNDEQTVLARFSAAGVIGLLRWQANNKFPANSPLMSEGLYHALSSIVAKEE